jgi:hypothetical protein
MIDRGTSVPGIVINNTIPDPTKITNQTANDTIIIGRWNTSNPNGSIVNGTLIVVPGAPVSMLNTQKLIPIFQENPTMMYIIAFSILGLFLLTHYAFRKGYHGEHNEQPVRDLRYQFVYKEYESRCWNYSRLLGLIMVIFNPVINIFAVYNKFLPRWVRNLMLQIYLMLISIAFGINASLVSIDMSDVFSEGPSFIGLYLIVVICILLGRPYALRVLYGLLYEPYSRVESFQNHETTMHNNELRGRKPLANSGGGAQMALEDYENQRNMGYASQIEIED